MPTYNIFGSQTPANADNAYASPHTYGTRFYADVSGTITGIRWYKGNATGGNSHTVALYNAAGTLLASKATSNESSSGWHTTLFDSSVNIAANTAYTSAVFWPSGYGPYTQSYFTSQLDNSPLHAYANSNGGNGVYSLLGYLAFPATLTIYGECYFSDVIFQTGDTGEFIVVSLGVSATTVGDAVSGASVAGIVNSGAASEDISNTYVSVDPNLILDGGKILNYLWNLKNRTDLKVISGQRDYNTSTLVQTQTGQWPGLLSWEIGATGLYTYPGTAQSSTRRSIYQTQWGAGGLITDGWIPHNPKTNGLNTDLDFTTTDAASLLTGSGTISDNFNTFCSNHNTDYAWCESNGIVLIVRLMTEFNKPSQQWWSAPTRVTAAQYIQVYRRVVDYYKAQGLHNIIWAWGFHIGSDAAYDVDITTYYPGDDYVDIIAPSMIVDVSGTKEYIASDFTWYNIIKQNYPTKILGWGVYGPRPGGDEGTADLGKMLPALKTYCPNVCFFANWTGAYSMDSAYNTGADVMLDDPWIINRDEIDFGGSGGGGGGTISNEVKFLSCGPKAYANNQSITPEMPEIWSPGNRLVAVVVYSSPTGVVATPGTWEKKYQLGDSFGKVYTFTKIAEIGDVSPTFHVSNGASGDGVLGTIFSTTICDITDAGADTINASQININVSAPYTPPPPQNTIDVDGITYEIDWQDDFNSLDTARWSTIEYGVTSQTSGNWDPAIATPTVSGSVLSLPIVLDNGIWYQSGIQGFNEINNVSKKKFPVNSYIEMKVRIDPGDMPAGGGDFSGIIASAIFLPAILQGAEDYAMDDDDGRMRYQPYGGLIEAFRSWWSESDGHLLWSGVEQADNSRAGTISIKRYISSDELALTDWNDWHVASIHRYVDGGTVRIKCRVDGNLMLECYGASFTSEPLNPGPPYTDNTLIGQWPKVEFAQDYVPPPSTDYLGRNAVYMYFGWGNPPDPVAVMSATGIKQFTFFSIAPDAYGNPLWDGQRALSGATEQTQMNNVRANGGDVVVTFWGTLGVVRTTAASLAQAYQSVIDFYSLKAIDTDMEGSSLWDSADVRQRVIDGLKIVQNNNPSVIIYITLGALPNNVYWAVREMFERGAAAGLNAIWVGMPFDWSEGHTGTMGEATIASMEPFKAALQTAYGYDSDTAYRHIGISSMNGLTDTGETVTFADFDTILAYARAHSIGRFTFWSLNRDRSCDGTNNVLTTCSYVTQSPYDYTRIIAAYHG